jgi:uncharacterized cupin superfamily protein
VRRLNLLTATLDDRCDRNGYRSQSVRVGEAIGADEIGGRLVELADGERSHPYHWHHTREEWLVVVAGSPALRTPGGTCTLAEGDVVCFAAGPDGAHQVIGPGTVLVLSDNRASASAEYPESGKVATGMGEVFRRTDAVDLWEGE